MATSNAPVTVNIVGAIIQVTATSDGQTRDSSNRQDGNSQQSTSSGRPMLDIQMDDIKALRRLNYKWKKIAKILGVSRATLYRRLKECGDSNYTRLTNEQLDEIIRGIKQNHPNDGEILIQGHLCSRDIQIPRQALRESIHRIDSSGVAERRRSAVKRRIYSVPYPNFVWHIDGHHKLIRWRFVIHGAIDGFSRMITFLQCSDNNRADTVFSSFITAVEQYGIPDHVRTDHGGENIEVWKYMIAAHNIDFSTIITGSSVHNERIERLWRDVNRCVCQQFSFTFKILEDNNRLDPLNEVDIYCLHYLFTPIINKCLLEFKESWNYHCMSSEGNKTPYQLCSEGICHNGIGAQFYSRFEP